MDYSTLLWSLLPKPAHLIIISLGILSDVSSQMCSLCSSIEQIKRDGDIVLSLHETDAGTATVLCSPSRQSRPGQRALQQQPEQCDTILMQGIECYW